MEVYQGILVYIYIYTRYILYYRNSTKSLKLLNSFSIFAICFQYALLACNYHPNQDDIPPDVGLVPSDFSLIHKLGLTDPYWLSYLGFSRGPLVDCKVIYISYIVI
jgi:hypothetical protein